MALTVEQIQTLKKLTKGLKTANNFSKKKNCTRRTIYNMANDTRLQSIKIDGVMFIIP